MVSRVAFWARFGDRYKRLGVDWRGRVMGMNVAPIIQSFEREKNTLLNRSHAIKVESVGDELDQKWTPVFIWSMSLQEMEKAGVQGQQVCFVVLLSKIGTPIWSGRVDDDCGLKLRMGWEGMRAEETPPLVRFEKTFPEPPANFAMYPGAKYWVEVVDDDGTPSDRVTGITLANEADVDAFAHHACLVVFQLQEFKQVIVAPQIRPDGGYATVPLEKIRAAQRAAKALQDALMGLG